jgi:hypothetical protein
MELQTPPTDERRNLSRIGYSILTFLLLASLVQIVGRAMGRKRPGLPPAERLGILYAAGSCSRNT